MGEYVLKTVVVVYVCCFICSQCLLDFFKLTVSALPLAVDTSQPAEDIVDIRNRILESINMPALPAASVANISQSEFERAHRQYFTIVQLNERKRLSAVHKNNDTKVEESLEMKNLYTFKHEGKLSQKNKRNLATSH